MQAQQQHGVGDMEKFVAWDEEDPKGVMRRALAMCGAIQRGCSLTMMEVICTRSMTVRRGVSMESVPQIKKGSQRGNGMVGMDVEVIRGGTRSVLMMTTTMIGECGQGRGANQGMMAMLIIQGRASNFAY
jgi:hypothetical protein